MITLTWHCNACDRKRLDKDISVLSFDISNMLGATTGTAIRNFKYCNDNLQCIEAAKKHKLRAAFGLLDPK